MSIWGLEEEGLIFVNGEKNEILGLETQGSRLRLAFGCGWAGPRNVNIKNI